MSGNVYLSENYNEKFSYCFSSWPQWSKATSRTAAHFFSAFLINAAKIKNANVNEMFILKYLTNYYISSILYKTNVLKKFYMSFVKNEFPQEYLGCIQQMRLMILFSAAYIDYFKNHSKVVNAMCKICRNSA